MEAIRLNNADISRMMTSVCSSFGKHSALYSSKGDPAQRVCTKHAKPFLFDYMKHHKIVIVHVNHLPRLIQVRFVNQESRWVYFELSRNNLLYTFKPVRDQPDLFRTVEEFYTQVMIHHQFACSECYPTLLNTKHPTLKPIVGLPRELNWTQLHGRKYHSVQELLNVRPKTEEEFSSVDELREYIRKILFPWESLRDSTIQDQIFNSIKKYIR